MASRQPGSSPAQVGWCLVVPVKRLHLAKSRLRAGPVERATLALAFAEDTVFAAVRTPTVVAVIVVTDDPVARQALSELGADVIPDSPDAGLNPALRHGAAHAAMHYPGTGIGALSADLPALRPEELAAALERAAQLPSTVIADAQGTGTTAYFAMAGVPFAPAFGRDSLRVHLEAGAVAMPAHGLTSVRRDVDTQADLVAAVRLGVGSRTGAVLERGNRSVPSTRG